MPKILLAVDGSEHALLAGAKRILDEAGAICTQHVFVDHAAQTIVEQARHFRGDTIYPDTHCQCAAASALGGSDAINIVTYIAVALVH